MADLKKERAKLLENPTLDNIQKFINKFDMRPASIIERLDLLNVDYTKDTMFSHFGNNNRNWEKIENV